MVVLVLEPLLVDVGMRVGIVAVVLMLVLVLHVFVLMAGVRMAVGLPVVAVLVGVWSVVAVLVGHGGPPWLLLS